MFADTTGALLQALQQNQSRERIGPGGYVGGRGFFGGRQSQINQMPPMMQGLGSQSQGIFQNYMRGIFNNPYMPPSIPGIYGQQPGGYMGFFGRQLPPLPAAPQQAVPQGGIPGFPNQPGADPSTPNNPYGTGG